MRAVGFLFVSIFCSGVVAGKFKELDFDLDTVLCENRLVAFFVTDNADVPTKPSKEISNITEDECRTICANNRDLHEKSVLCGSFSYDHVAFTCSIYRNKAEPDGELETANAPGKRYFEKFCLAEDAPAECGNEQFLRVDNTVLVGYANSTSIFSTMAECANKCIMIGKQCKSAMYFYAEGECITNEESAASRPEDFKAPDDGDKVIYFDNGCKYDDKVKVIEEEEADSNETKMGISKKKLNQQKPEKKQKTEKNLSKESISTTSLSVSAESIPVEASESVAESQEQHPKDVKNLYGAKQLTESENGTFIQDNAESTTSKQIQEMSQETDQNSSAETTTAPKTNPTKNLHIHRLAAVDDGFLSEWGDWTPCINDGDRRIRRRKCLDLKQCRGALTQVDTCVMTQKSLENSENEQTGPIGPVQSPLPITKSSAEGLPPSILPPQMPRKKLTHLPEGAPGTPDDVWSPWPGTCQHFASSQPCKNHEIIGFESRECIAQDPKSCKGPFFRYCTLPC